MIILAVLALLVPAVIGVLLYERFKGYLLIWRKRIELFLIFAFLINMSVYGVLWIRGWTGLSWTSTEDSTMTQTAVVFQYMLIALIVTVILAYVLSLVRVGLSRGNAPEQDEAPVAVTATEPAAAPVEAAVQITAPKRGRAPKRSKTTESDKAPMQDAEVIK